MAESAATILIVDDEPTNRRLLQTLLRPEGYQTLTAANGAEALELVAQSAPDLILLDVMMPGISGYKVAEILKSGLATSHIPIIMVTALVDGQARLAGLNAGAEEFLSKPVDRAELQLRVRNLLRLKSLGDQQAHAKEEILELNTALEERVRQRTAQLQLANEELEAFSYSVSHDLRTPLSSIEGFSGLLVEEIGPRLVGDRSVHYLTRIRANVRQMGDLIDALLSLAQVSRSGLYMESVDLSALAAKIRDEYAEREPGRSVRFDIQPGVSARGDADLLRRVLDNLLGNAWKFTCRVPDALVTFSCKTLADGATVYSVTDNGAGFDVAYASKLFGAFQRLHTQAEFPGTGIGLATVRRIVSRHGGRIWADCEPGKGAAFHFTLGPNPS